MYRMLIVDDEDIEREAFRILLEQEIPLIQVVGEASNGRQAMEMVHLLKPDIITMDIKMPGINGIDALKEIKREFADIKVIMLTAYDYFSYAQQAINSGSFAFLLKPVKRSEIKEIMQKVIDSIEAERQKSKNQLELREKLNNVLPLVESELARYFIAGNEIYPIIWEYADILNFSLQAGYCMVIIIETNHNKNLLHTENGIQRISSDAYNLIRDILKDTRSSCIISQLILNIITVFVPVEQNFEYNKVKTSALEIAQKVSSMVKRKFDVDIRFGIGIPVSSVKNFYDSYNQAVYCLKNTVSLSKTICYYDDVNFTCAGDNAMYPIEKEKILLDKIRSGDERGSNECFNSIFMQLNDISNYQSHEFKFYIIQLATAISHLEFEYLNKSYFFQILKSIVIVNSDGLNQVKEMMSHGLKRVIKDIDQNRYKQGDSIINKVCDYLCKNYSKSLCLESAAKTVSVNPFYLSKLFKITTGQNFSDYLTSVRLNEAKILLKETNQSLKQITINTGYNNPDYFCKAFKKYIGLTPTEYRAISNKL